MLFIFAIEIVIAVIIVACLLIDHNLYLKRIDKKNSDIKKNSSKTIFKRGPNYPFD